MSLSGSHLSSALAQWHIDLLEAAKASQIFNFFLVRGSLKTLNSNLSLSEVGTMSHDVPVDRRKRTQVPISGNADGNRNGNGYANGVVEDDELRLRLRPNENHKPESYEDLQLDFSPLLFSSLEQYLPFNMLNLSRELKLQYMRHILLRYSPEGERTRVRFNFHNLMLILFSLILFGCLECGGNEESEILEKHALCFSF